MIQNKYHCVNFDDKQLYSIASLKKLTFYQYVDTKKIQMNSCSIPMYIYINNLRTIICKHDEESKNYTRYHKSVLIVINILSIVSIIEGAMK